MYLTNSTYLILPAGQQRIAPIKGPIYFPQSYIGENNLFTHEQCNDAFHKASDLCSWRGWYFPLVFQLLIPHWSLKAIFNTSEMGA